MLPNVFCFLSVGCVRETALVGSFQKKLKICCSVLVLKVDSKLFFGPRWRGFIY